MPVLILEATKEMRVDPIPEYPLANQSPSKREDPATYGCGHKAPLNTFNTVAQLPSEILTVVPASLSLNRDNFAMPQVRPYWRAPSVSSTLLWTWMDFQNLTRTIAGLEYNRPAPLFLELHGGFSAGALMVVLDHGNAFTAAYVGPHFPHAIVVGFRGVTLLPGPVLRKEGLWN